MQVNRGKVHNYLGMKLDYTTVGQVNITMLEYIDEIRDAFDKADPTVGGTQSSAEPDIIFNLNEYYGKLNSKQDVEFHHVVAKTLFATRWARPDTCTAISLLATIVREPDMEYFEIWST